jgi:hypothetical protein
MSEQWFYARGGQQAGPVSFAQLTELAHTGGLGATDLVWQEGTPDWQPAGQVSGLFAAPVANVPPAPAYSQAPGPPGAPPYAQPYGQYVSSTGQSYANDARTAMILSIIGIFCFGIVLGPIGIVMGNKAKKNMRASGNMEGEGMATAAIVIGWIIVGLAALSILIFIALAALGGR